MFRPSFDAFQGPDSRGQVEAELLVNVGQVVCVSVGRASGSGVDGFSAEACPATAYLGASSDPAII